MTETVARTYTPEDHADAVKWVRGRLEDAGKATAGPWFPYFTTHGDPHVVTDPERPKWTITVSTSPDDYGRSNAIVIAQARTYHEPFLRYLLGRLEVHEPYEVWWAAWPLCRHSQLLWCQCSEVTAALDAVAEMRLV